MELLGHMARLFSVFYLFSENTRRTNKSIKYKGLIWFGKQKRGDIYLYVSMHACTVFANRCNPIFKVSFTDAVLFVKLSKYSSSSQMFRQTTIFQLCGFFAA
jgi:hypothetical protein